ncbi:MAG TPA: hypothetical protein VF615_25570 [Longimicrobiaceae bacterium]
MSYHERVEEIAGKLATLAGAGFVYARLRLVSDWGRYIALFRDPESQRVNGWQVTRRGPGQTPERSTRWAETYVLHKLLGINDAEESDFAIQEQVDAAIRLFRDEPDLVHGSVQGALKLVSIEPRTFGGVLCHVGELELTLDFYFQDL